MAEHASALRPDAIVAVFGAGTMGAGIAQIAALHGHRVQLHDVRFGAADAAKKAIGEAFARETAKGRLGATAADAALQRISTVVTLPDICVAALVVEAIAEDLAAKRELFASIENVVDARVHPRLEHVVALDHRVGNGHRSTRHASSACIFSTRCR